jgi:replication-associated recombination protein RarA
VEMQYLPKDVKDTFYKPTPQGYEKYISERLNKLWPKRYKK